LKKFNAFSSKGAVLLSIAIPLLPFFLQEQSVVETRRTAAFLFFYLFSMISAANKSGDFRALPALKSPLFYFYLSACSHFYR